MSQSDCYYEAFLASHSFTYLSLIITFEMYHCYRSLFQFPRITEHLIGRVFRFPLRKLSGEKKVYNCNKPISIAPTFKSGVTSIVLDWL
jgi:hypothetical protein